MKKRLFFLASQVLFVLFIVSCTPEHIAPQPDSIPPVEIHEGTDVGPMDYDTFDPASVAVDIPVSLLGYRQAYEEDEPELTRQYGRDVPAAGMRMAISSRDEVASRVGFRVLQYGGNAADAAFATAAAISVREPWFSHFLGGGTWALYRDAAGTVQAVDGAGTIGSDADPEFFKNPANLRQHGMEWAIVPGAWDAWLLWLDEFGSMELDLLLAPAVDLAENGVSVSTGMAAWIRLQEESISSRPETAAVFLPNGRVPDVGQRIYQRDLAKTMKMIIAAYREARPAGRTAALQAARDIYYDGPVAAEIVEYSRRNRGSLVPEDFRRYRAELRDPLMSSFHEWQLYNPPPNSQGIVMPLALGILENFDLRSREWDNPGTIHLVAEAMNLAHIDKHHYVGDPEHIDIPLDRLLSKNYARSQAKRIDPAAAMAWPQAGGLEAHERNTTTFSVLDSQGNAAAITTSTGSQFVVAGRTGILINQRLQNVFYQEDNPNALVPGRRVRHTVNPYMAELPGRKLVIGGNTGYDTQPQGQIQQFLHLALFGANAQQAVSRPRFIVHSFPDITYPHEVRNELALEWGFRGELQTALEERGHRVSRRAIFGNASVIVVDFESGRIEAGADPRGENLAIAW